MSKKTEKAIAKAETKATKTKAPKTTKATKTQLNPVFAVVQKGTFRIINLEDYPEVIKDQLKTFDGQRVADKATLAMFKETLTSNGLQLLDRDTAKARIQLMKAEASMKKAEAKAEAKAKAAWEPRRFMNVVFENQDNDEPSSWEEVTPKLRNHVGIYHLCVNVKDADAPIRLYTVDAMYENWNTTAIVTDYYTHDVDTIRPEQVRARQIWDMEEDGTYTDEQKADTTHLLIPVRRIANPKTAEPKPEVEAKAEAKPETKTRKPKAETKTDAKAETKKPRKPRAGKKTESK